MKRNLILFFLIFISFSGFSQNSNDKTIYLDSDWHETNEAEWVYYRIIKDYFLEMDIYKIFDYYKDGTLQMSGFSKTKDLTARDGEFVYYYKNGNKQKISNYLNSKLIGDEYQWYDNGSKRMEGEYVNNDNNILSQLKVRKYWNENGEQMVVDGNGIYEEIFKDYYAKGLLKDGFKHAVWEGKDNNLNITFRENYIDGKFISGEKIDNDGGKDSYFSIETPPKPKKDMKDFYEFIAKNFKITSKSIRYGIKGKIILNFIIEKDGKITDVKIVKGLGYGLDEEAIRVVSSYENWIPGKQRCRAVRVLYLLPISI